MKWKRKELNPIKANKIIWKDRMKQNEIKWHQWNKEKSMRYKWMKYDEIK